MKAVANAHLRIVRKEQEKIVFEDDWTTDQKGNSEIIALYAPSKAISLEQESKESPYATYTLEIKSQQFQPYRIENIQIFDGQKSVIELDMDQGSIPTQSVEQKQSYALMTSKPVMKQSDAIAVIASMSKGVVIPTSIRVHLGRPDRNAENLTLPFLYYLKNVASSEVFPTWPYEAIKANVYCQMSLALNRVFTEWYPSKGYNFDITNSTAFDQAFVKNRNIFGIMSDIVDEVFMQYLRKEHFLEPFYAEYCDGRQAQCPGLKQWGTLDLANRGMDALEIIRYYYGNTIFIVQADEIGPIIESYPGTPLRRGSTGIKVRELQEQLNAIAINYPAIPPIFPIDGIYGADTEAAVRVFQRQFNLSVDGITGRGTWYRVSSIYAAVRKLAELGSIGILRNMYEGVWPGSILRLGNRSIETQLMQYYLSVIHDSYPAIPDVTIDGIYGNSMRTAVIRFQTNFGLLPDGVIGRATWEQIVNVYESLINTELQSAIATVSKTNTNTVNHQEIQALHLKEKLNQLSELYPQIKQGPIVLQLQKMLGLKESGEMNEQLMQLIDEMMLEVNSKV